MNYDAMLEDDEYNRKDYQLIYIGRDFYLSSGTAMSSIYREGFVQRWDWSMVQKALDKGDYVHIRPATESEMDEAFRMLGRYTIRRQ